MAAVENCLLKISNSHDITGFLHVCVDDLIGRKRPLSDNYGSDIEWTPEEFEQARNFIQTVFKQSVIHGETFDAKIEKLGEDAVRAIRECFEVRKSEITQFLVRENLIKNGCALVENLDWKLKWVLGSSKLASIGEPLLQVDFHCLRKDDDRRKTINFEMDLEQVDKMIAELERIKLELK